MVSFYKEKEDFFVWSGFCVMLKIYIENKAAVIIKVLEQSVWFIKMVKNALKSLDLFNFYLIKFRFLGMMQKFSILNSD